MRARIGGYLVVIAGTSGAPAAVMKDAIRDYHRYIHRRFIDIRTRVAALVPVALLVLVGAGRVASAQTVQLAPVIESRNPAMWLNQTSRFTSKDKKLTANPVTAYVVAVGDAAPASSKPGMWGEPLVEDIRSADDAAIVATAPRLPGVFCLPLAVTWLKKASLAPSVSTAGTDEAITLPDVRFRDLPDKASAATKVASWIYGADGADCGLSTTEQTTWLREQLGLSPDAAAEDDVLARKKLRLSSKAGGYPIGTRLFAATVDTAMGVYILDDDTIVYYDATNGPGISNRAGFFATAAGRSLATFIVLPRAK
jgi:hypothetical protein